MSTPDHKPPALPVDDTNPSSDDEDDYYEDDDDDEELEDGAFDKEDYEDDDSDISYENYVKEIPYSSLKTPPPTSSEPCQTNAKWWCYVLQPIADIAWIYIRFIMVAVAIYFATHWYAVHYGNLDSSESVKDESDMDTCPAGLSA